MNPASPAAEVLADLGWFAMLLGIAVGIVVLTLVVVPVIRRRGTLEEHVRYDAQGDTRWLSLGGFGASAVILAVIFVATMGTLARFPLADAETEHAQAELETTPAEAAAVPTDWSRGVRPDTDIQVIGRQWWWEVKYRTDDNRWITSANEIHIPAGRTMLLALQTRDVIHSFWVPRLHGKVDLLPEQVNYIRLRADSTGVYRGRCAEYCGAQHTHMEFLVVAHSDEEFRAWMAREASKAADPSTADARRGAELFRTHACNFCHTIRGVAPGGAVAPDLTHFGSRRTIAAGLLPNARGYLEAWIVNAPSLKPGTKMPAMNQFTGVEARQLVAYLESLE